CERPHGIERPRARQHAVAADAPPRRFQSDDTVERGRMAYRATRVRAERAIAGARRDGGAGSARRASAHVQRVPGVAAIAEVFVVSRRIACELRHVERSEPYRAGGLQALDDRRSDASAIVAQDLRPGGRDVALTVEEILVRERYAVQRTERRAALEQTVRGSRSLQSLIGLHRYEAVEVWLHALRAVETRA